MPTKPKVGFYWCAACGGCEEAIVDFAEDLLGVVDAVEIVFWPCAMDFKKAEVEAMPDRSITATLLNGAIRNSEQEEMARLLRRKSQYLIAYGACAQLGGIPSLANQFSREQVLRYVYDEAPTVINEAKIRPQTSFTPGRGPLQLSQPKVGVSPLAPRETSGEKAGEWGSLAGASVGATSSPQPSPPKEERGKTDSARSLGEQAAGSPREALTLPGLRQVVRALDQVVEVDYYIPGCPPTPKITQIAITALLAGQLPPKGSVLAPDVALCDQCPRKATKPADLIFTEFRRPHITRMDPEKCFLAQGVVCMGPATRAGCEAACTGGGMPCGGCFGPTSRVRDQGAKILSSLCANVGAKEEESIAKTLAGIPDPVGTFYRYGLAKSLLRRKVDLTAG